MEDINFSELSDAHRDKISTVDQQGKRVWIYVKKVSGKFFNYRQIVAYLLIAFLVLLPWIQINGEPFVLFNLLEGKFIIFGQHFTHQDFHIFVVAMLIGLVFIVLFTAVFGRLFCGWICPQTIFMEMVFRRIEWAIEGDANAQRKLDAAPWDYNKIWRRSVKHFIFILISAFISHTFLSYIIGVKELGKLVSGNPMDHWEGLVAMIVFTGAFYGVFARLREQVCTTICPYGRLQGVMLDANSLAVAYDFVRGEPRGKIKKNHTHSGKEVSAADVLNLNFDTPQNLGDCVDCKLCIHVCPTGIDIRNGMQLECVNCTACMDACDEVMVKVNRPTGLIRIDSHNGIIQKKKSIWNTRVAAYSLVLLVLIGLESFLFVSRNPIEALFLRTPGTLYQNTDNGMISNLYNYQIVNKSADESHELTFIIEGISGVEIEFIGQKPKLVKNGISQGSAFIKIPKDALTERKTSLRIKILDGSVLLDDVSTTFFGPVK